VFSQPSVLSLICIDGRTTPLSPSRYTRTAPMECSHGWRLAPVRGRLCSKKKSIIFSPFLPSSSSPPFLFSPSPVRKATAERLWNSKLSPWLGFDSAARLRLSGGPVYVEEHQSESKSKTKDNMHLGEWAWIAESTLERAQLRTVDTRHCEKPSQEQET